MAGEHSFNVAILALLERLDFGWVAADIRAGWSAAALPGSPTQNPADAVRQAQVVADSLDVVSVDLESLNALRTRWPDAAFADSANPDVVSSLTVQAQATDADALGSLRAATELLRTVLLEEDELGNRGR